MIVGRALFTIALLAGTIFAQRTVEIRAERTYLRDAPNSKGIVLATVRRDDSFTLVTQSAPWYLVRNGENIGWIHRNEITIFEPSQGVGSGLGCLPPWPCTPTSPKAISREKPANSDTNSYVLNRPLRLLSKPRAEYTAEARLRRTMGVVVLKVTFLATGEVGNVMIEKGLPLGLNKQAIEAAKLISFEPKMIYGIPRNHTTTITYSFTLY